MSKITKEWITVSEAADRLKCSTRTVLRLVGAGCIEKVQLNPRLYLVKSADVETERKKEQTFGRPRGT